MPSRLELQAQKRGNDDVPGLRDRQLSRGGRHLLMYQGFEDLCATSRCCTRTRPRVDVFPETASLG